MSTEDLEVFRVADLSTILKCGRNAAYDLVRSGAIRSVSIGRSIRIPKAALIEFLANGSDPTVPDEAALNTTPNREEKGGHVP